MDEIYSELQLSLHLRRGQKEQPPHCLLTLDYTPLGENVAGVEAEVLDCHKIPHADNAPSSVTWCAIRKSSRVHGKRKLPLLFLLTIKCQLGSALRKLHTTAPTPSGSSQENGFRNGFSEPLHGIMHTIVIAAPKIPTYTNLENDSEMGLSLCRP